MWTDAASVKRRIKMPTTPLTQLLRHFANVDSWSYFVRLAVKLSQTCGYTLTNIITTNY